ncbi:hypothetical protein IWQ61_004265 [Dispira simplex]|nr:hypothetical protein IWQ61_004265 [Dispira simplex]
MSTISYEGGSGYAVLDKPSDMGLVIIQEWWGVNQQMKNMARRFADQGFLTVVPDLYHGRLATNSQEATHLMDGLDWPGALVEIQASVNFLKSKGAKNVGVTGFCMGGALSGASAVKVDGIAAVAPFYGIPPKALCDLAQTRVPVQGHFGLKDMSKNFSDPETVKTYKTQLQQSGVPHEIFMYDADHAFMNEARPEVFVKEASDLAFARTTAFFKKHLQ